MNIPAALFMKDIPFKKLSLLTLLLALTGMGPLCAIEFKKDATPQFTGTGLSLDLETALNNALDGAFQSALDEINANIGNINGDPQKLINAFANSSVFASTGATPRAYGGYKLFSVTLGPMAGIQLPSSPFEIADEFKDLTKKLQNEGDLALGLNPQVLNAQIGINTSRFLLKNLYLGIKVGYMNLDDMVEGLSFESLTLGLTANYQLINRKSLAAGLLLWRGVNLGTGVIYQGTNLGYKAKIAVPSPQSISASSGTDTITGTLEIDPKIALEFDIKTVTIPLEAVTSVRLLWFLNLNLGLGVDLGFGKAELEGKADADIKIKDLKMGQTALDTTPGNISTTIGGDNSPDIFNFKLMTGLGLSLGPVVLDVPITWYPINNGFSAGLTLGVVW